jgi:hypothetical protein
MTALDNDRGIGGMSIQQERKDLENQIEALKAQEQSFNWNDVQVICELNGYRWLLGPETDEEINWDDAKDWCKLVGGELPPRDILLQCFMNDDIKPLFKTSWHWSSTEFTATYAWCQHFYNGNQFTTNEGTNYYVRAVKRVKI